MGETSILYKARVALAKSIAPRVRNPQREIWPYGDGSYSGFRLALARRLPELRLDPYGLALAAETSVWAKACIDLRKSAVSRMPWAIYDAAGNVLDNTPFHAMMKYARVAYQQNLFALWEQSLSVHGESYMEKLYNGDIPGFSIPGGLRILNTIAIEPQIQNGAIQYYQYSASGGKYKLNLSDLFIHRYASLTDDYRASAPMTTAMDAVGIKRNMQNYLRGYFDNDSTPGGIVSPKQGVSVDKNFVDRVMTNWANAFKGANNRNSTGFVSDPIDYEQFDNKLPEHQQELSDDEIAEICAAFRVPVAMVKSGGVKDPLGGGGKMDSSRQMFYEDFTEPECEDIQTFINDVIIPWLMPNSGAEFLFDFDEIRSLIKDTKERSDKVINEFNNGAITFNQLQIALDYEPIEGGDWYQFTSGKIIIQAKDISSAGALLAPPPPPLPPPPPAPAALPAPVENKDALQLPAPVPPTGKSAALMLHMGNHPDLIGLQNKTRAYVGETPVKWSDPTSFHVTLASMPVVTDEQIKALQTALEDVDVPDMPLKVGSLNTFDNLDSHAVHFKVRKSVDLIDLQETIHDLIASLGIPMSSFSAPEAYKPHITVGYADSKPPARTFDSHLTVKPTALHLGVGEDVVWQKPIGDVITPEDEPAVKYDPNQPRADDGKFGSGGGGSSHGSATEEKKPDQSSADTNINSNSGGTTETNHRDWHGATKEQTDEYFNQHTVEPSGYAARAVNSYVNDYVGTGAFTNMKLRGGANAEGLPPLDSRQKRFMSDLDETIGENHLPDNTVLYRGVTGPHANQLSTLKAGDTFMDKGYGSTSLSKTVPSEDLKAGDALIQIKAPKGTNGVYVNSVFSKSPDYAASANGQYSHQQEVLLGRDTKYKVVSVEQGEGHNIINVEIIK